MLLTNVASKVTQVTNHSHTCFLVRIYLFTFLIILLPWLLPNIPTLTLSYSWIQPMQTRDILSLKRWQQLWPDPYWPIIAFAPTLLYCTNQCESRVQSRKVNALAVTVLSKVSDRLTILLSTCQEFDRQHYVILWWALKSLHKDAHVGVSAIWG